MQPTNPNKSFRRIPTILSLCVSLLLGLNTFAQNYSFNETGSLTILDSNGQALEHAACGGFNQAQFLSIDVNNDGTKDVVIYDRTGKKILPFVWQSRKLVYKPEYEAAFPHIESWIVGTDFNADDKTDIWFAKQGNIALYRNETGATDKIVRFVRVSDELRGYNFNNTGIDTTSLYSMQFNQPAMADVDLDGDIDVLTLQPFGYGITLFLNVTVEKNLPLDPPDFEEVDFCWGDFEEAPDNDSIYLRRNKFCFSANYRYKKKHSGGSSLLLIDVDNDNDNDLVLGNAGFNNIILLKNGKNEFKKKCDTMTSYDLQWPPSKPARVDHYPASFYLDVDNDGLKDLVVAASLADYSSGYTREREQIWYYKNQGTEQIPDFKHVQDDFMVGQTLDYGGYAAPELYDMDGDGDLDMLLATNGDYFITRDSFDRIVYLENVGTKTDPVFQEKLADFGGLSTKGYMNLTMSLGNLDDDGVLDLIIGKVDGRMDWYNVTKVGQKFMVTEVDTNIFDIQVAEAAAPAIVDVDKDQLPDLLIGCYGGNTYYYRNTGSASSPDMTHVTDTFGKVISNGFLLTTSGETGKDTFVHNFIGYSYPRLIDINGDGTREFISGSHDGEVKVWDQVENRLSDTFNEVKNLYFDPFFKQCIQKDFGSRSIPAIADLNGDGKMDMIVGNRRGGIHYLESSDTNCLVASVEATILERSVSVFPNPVEDDRLYIRVNDGIKINGLQMYDLSGRLVLSEYKDFRSLNMSELPAGIYTLSISTTAGKVHKKIVKQH